MDSSLRRNSKGMKYAGVEVSGGRGCAIREGATLIGGSIEKAFTYPGSGQSHGVNLGVMITPTRTIDLWRASKFGEQDDESVINTATFV
tara:strand:+ start:70 stop:336 length:267 start_codon:yes stop_codon:yes gene_type:complete